MVAHSSLVKFVPDALCYYRRGNPMSLGSIRSDRALASLTRSTLLCVESLLELRNDEQTRQASLTHLSNVAKEIYPRRPDLLSKLDHAARRISGVSIYPIKTSTTLRVAAGLVGWQRAKLLKQVSWNSKVAILKHVDRLRFALGGRCIRWHPDDFPASLIR